MKTYYVKDLQKGLVINNESFAVKLSETGTTKDGKAYYKLLLIDKTGEIKAQVWNDKIPNVEKGCLKPGNIVMINGTVEDYRGVLQLNVFGASRVSESKVSDYMEASDFDIDELWTDLNNHISSIKSPDIQTLMAKTLADADLVRKFRTYPAAEYVHHDFQGGLLEHVVEMMDTVQPLRRFYPEANFDLVIVGIFFHDIGKLWELEPVGVTIERTNEGYLMGHLVKSFEVFSQLASGTLKPETMLSIQHIILAHHGSKDFGSPVVPASIEAAIVFGVDYLSTKIRIFQKVLRKNTENEGFFSETDKFIGGKVFLGDFKNVTD